MNALECPQCENELPTDAPEGLCPHCLLSAGLSGSLVSAAASGSIFEAPDTSEIGEAFPRFDVVRLIGRGGMGAVYEARDRELGRKVALKILPPELAADPSFAERFLREARTTALLDHPNVVRIHEAGEAGEFLYLVLEYVDGRNLREVVAQEGRLHPARVLSTMEQVAAGLAYAHRQGVVHRDVKPENVLIDASGRVRLADFGLAKLAEGGLALSLTGTRQALGTPHYMAPEQLERPESVDQRADVYAAGVLFYELLTGRLPLGRFPHASEEVDVDEIVDEIVDTCLDRDPERRYADGEALREAIVDLSGQPVGAHAAGEAPSSHRSQPHPPSRHDPLVFRAKKKHGWPWLLIACLPMGLAGFLVLGVLFFMLGSDVAPLRAGGPEPVPVRTREGAATRTVKLAATRLTKRAKVFQVSAARFKAVGFRLPEEELRLHLTRMTGSNLRHLVGEPLYAGDVIQTDSGSQVVLVPSGKSLVAALPLSFSKGALAPPPQLTYPDQIPSLDYWKDAGFVAIPLSKAFVRTQPLDYSEATGAQIWLPGNGWAYSVTRRAEQAHRSRASHTGFYLDLRNRTIEAYSDEELNSFLVGSTPATTEPYAPDSAATRR